MRYESPSYSLFPNLPYNLLKDREPVAVMASVPFILAVHPSLPVKSVRELIAFARARPGQLSFASSGAGGGPHLTAEMFKMRTGLQLLHVPYRGTAQANTDVVSGQVTMIFSPAPSVMPHVKSKRVRALAIAGTERHADDPHRGTRAGWGQAFALGLPLYFCNRSSRGRRLVIRNSQFFPSLPGTDTRRISIGPACHPVSARRKNWAMKPTTP